MPVGFLLPCFQSLIGRANVNRPLPSARPINSANFSLGRVQRKSGSLTGSPGVGGSMMERVGPQLPSAPQTELPFLPGLVPGSSLPPSALRLSTCLPPPWSCDRSPWEERPAGIFDPQPGALTFGAPKLTLNPLFMHLMSNDCASGVTGDVHLRKQPQSCQAPVHFLKQNPRGDSINIL